MIESARLAAPIMRSVRRLRALAEQLLVNLLVNTPLSAYSIIVNDEPHINGPKTNAEIRQWYIQRISEIPQLNKDWVKQGLHARARAEAAWRIRHEARIEARSMMADPTEVELLRARDVAKYGNPDGPTFEFLVERLREASLEEDRIYEAIIDNSYRTDAELNRKLGL